MPRKRSAADPQKKDALRGSKIAVPDWWVEMSEAMFRASDPGMSLGQLGAELAAPLGRDAWSHAKVSRFFGKKLVTDEVADALKKRYPELPDYVYFPQDPDEAIAFAGAQRRAVERRRREAEAMAKRVDVVLSLVERSTPDSTPDRRADDRQSDPVASPNVESAKGRQGGAAEDGRRGRLAARRS